MKQQSLAVTILAEQKIGILHFISDLASKYQCSLENTRVMTLGKHFAMISLIRGTWDALVKLENQFGSLAVEHGLNIQHERTDTPELSTSFIPYNFEVSTVEQAGVIKEVSGFFYQNKIPIREIIINTFDSHTGATMSYLLMKIYIPCDYSISDIRERLMILCDELNIDALLEPERA